MDEELNTKNCSNCGAPITEEYCPYCGTRTIFEDKEEPDYPIIECKEANIGFVTVLFPMIFAVAFGFAGIVMPYLIYTDQFSGPQLSPIGFLIFFPFAAVGVGAAIIAVTPIIRRILVHMHGQWIDGEVIGYAPDNLTINGEAAQVCKIKIDTDDGPKYILYQLGDVHQPFKPSTIVKLKVYKDMFVLKKEKQYYFNK